MISETQWQDFDRRGYLRLSGLLDGATITALRQRADDLALGRVELAGVQMQLDTGGAYEALPGAVERFEAGTLLYRKIQGLENDEVFSPLVRHPLIAEVCARIYGPPVPVSIFRAMVMNKPAGQGTHLPWHQDGGDVWQLDRDPQITFWVALDPATRENGCLQVIPGSHRLGLLSRHGSTLSDENAARHCPESAIEFLEMAAGDGVVFNNNLIHRSGTNPTAAPRRGFTACYMDGRTLSRLTGDHFPIVFGEPPTDADVYPFVRELRADNGRLRASAHESERYALSLEAEVEKLRAALTRESQAPPGPGASGAPPPRRLGQVLRGWLGR